MKVGGSNLTKLYDTQEKYKRYTFSMENILGSVYNIR